jgi:hypothetical protein
MSFLVGLRECQAVIEEGLGSPAHAVVHAPCLHLQVHLGVRTVQDKRLRSRLHGGLNHAAVYPDHPLSAVYDRRAFLEEIEDQF